MIGDPVRHSLSPILHNAAFSELNLDWAYLAFEVPSSSLGGALAGMRALGIDGLSVTMPHKGAVFEAVDRRSPVAERLSAVNTVVRRGSELEGHSTDGDGFLAAFDGPARAVRSATTITEVPLSLAKRIRYQYTNMKSNAAG